MRSREPRREEVIYEKGNKGLDSKKNSETNSEDDNVKFFLAQNPPSRGFDIVFIAQTNSPLPPSIDYFFIVREQYPPIPFLFPQVQVLAPSTLLPNFSHLTRQTHSSHQPAIMIFPNFLPRHLAATPQPPTHTTFPPPSCQHTLCAFLSPRSYFTPLLIFLSVFIPACAFLFCRRRAPREAKSQADVISEQRSENEGQKGRQRSEREWWRGRLEDDVDARREVGKEGQLTEWQCRRLAEKGVRLW